MWNACSCGKRRWVRESVIHNKTGVLTERDEHIFAHAVTELLSHKEKIRDMSQKAIKCTEDYWTVEKAGKRLMWHMNQVVDGH